MWRALLSKVQAKCVMFDGFALRAPLKKTPKRVDVSGLWLFRKDDATVAWLFRFFQIYPPAVGCLFGGFFVLKTVLPVSYVSWGEPDLQQHVRSRVLLLSLKAPQSNRRTHSCCASPL